MRAQAQINAERRGREKSTQVLIRFYEDRPDDAAVLAFLDATRGDDSRAELIKLVLFSAMMGAKDSTS